MRRRLSRIAGAATIAVLLALGPAACGDDESADSQAGESTSASVESEAPVDRAAEAAEFEPAPLEVSGEGADLREAAEAVHGFYVARATAEWDAACAQIAAPLLKKLEGLAAQSEVEGCGEFLEAFTTPMSNDAWRDVTVMDAESLRDEGGQATLVYEGAGGAAYSVPLREEGGEWKVEALQAATAG